MLGEKRWWGQLLQMASTVATSPSRGLGSFHLKSSPRGEHYEDVIREDLCFMFLGGVSERNLSMISTRLIGRRVFPFMEVSKADKELVDGVEGWRDRDLLGMG